jgi:hypothetical protein
MASPLSENWVRTSRWPARSATAFRTNAVGDLGLTECGWVVVPPTCCLHGRDYEPGWAVSSVWCTCNGYHTEWRCHCCARLYAPQPGPDCRIRDKGPVSIFKDEQRQNPADG